MNKVFPFLVVGMGYLILCDAVFPQGGAAAGRRGGANGSVPTDRRTSREEAAREKNQQVSAEAMPFIQRMDEQLKNILTLVNEQRRPDAAALTIADQVHKDSSRYVRKFDSAVQCEYGMLDAWLKYFKNDLQGAVSAASSAFKNKSDNNDARITYAAMSILSGRRPIGVVAKRERETTASAGNDRQAQAEARRQQLDLQRTRTVQTGEQLLTASTSSGGILQVDIDALNLELFDQKVPVFQAVCVNSTTFSYTPGQSALCLLFWQLHPKNYSVKTTSNPGEPNSISPSPMTNRRNTMANNRRDMMPGDGYGAPPDLSRSRGMDRSVPTGMGYDYSMMSPASIGTGSRATLESETAGFGQLFLTLYANPGIKFIAVNTDNAVSRNDAVTRILQSPWPWAQVFASDSRSGLGQFAKVEAETPILAISDTTGTIRYAGPASGFLAPLVLSHLGTMASNSSAVAPTIPNLVTPAPIMPPSPAAPSSQAVPAGMPAKTAVNGLNIASIEFNEPSEEDLENDPSLYEAAKKLEYAKTLFIPAGQKRMLTSKNGVETCREIMRRWPNTPYSEQARQLLRQVPPDERKRYNITNEELGL